MMATKGSVANIRKKLMSRLSGGDDRRNSPVKPLTTDAASSTTKKKDWPLHHQAKTRDRQQSSVDVPRSSVTTSLPQNNVSSIDYASSDVIDIPGQQTSAPVDLVASCSTPAHPRSTTSTSAITHDVISSQPLQHNHGSYARLF